MSVGVIFWSQIIEVAMFHRLIAFSLALLTPYQAQHLRGAASTDNLSKTNATDSARLLQSSPQMQYAKSQGPCRSLDGSFVKENHRRVGDGYTIEECAAECGSDCTAFEVNERRVCHVYSGHVVGNGDACCTCHTKTVSQPETTKLWPQFGENHSKCVISREHPVKDRLSCQLEAVAHGHKYYQYAEPLGGNPHCATSDSCADPIKGTVWPWKVYTNTKAMLKIDNVICPFFATMLESDTLPTKAAYSQDELLNFMMKAGVSERIAKSHVEGNFRHIHSNVIDLFNMEGLPNEHQTSTGILDCPSSYQAEVGGNGACAFDDLITNQKCEPVSLSGCINGDRVRQLGAFKLFWDAADTLPKDGMLSGRELRVAALNYNTRENNEFGRLSDINDGRHLNPPGPIGGTIRGSFRDLIRVFGETCNKISEETLRLVVLERQLPSHYSFPSNRTCG